MNELKQLYQAMEVLKSQGINVEPIEREIREKENDYVKNQIFSKIKPIVEETMALLKGNLSVSIERKSAGPISIKVSYNGKQISLDSSNIEGPKIQERVVSSPPKGSSTNYKNASHSSPDSEKSVDATIKINYRKDETNHKRESKKTNKRKKLKVKIDEKVFSGNVVAETFTNAIREIGKEVGFQRIYNLAILADGDFIITKDCNGTVNARYEYLADEWYVNTHSGTEKKKEILETISRQLGLRGRVRVELV